MDIKEFSVLPREERRSLMQKWKFEEGLTYLEIANRLGTTRNAIAGYCSRLNVRADPEKVSALRHQPKRRRKVVSTTPDRRVKLPKPTAPVVTPTELWMALPGATPVHLMQAGAKHCRWPIGDRTHTFCGLPPKEGSSFCETHSAMAFYPREAKEVKVGR